MKGKRKIVSLVMALILTFSMAAIPAVAGASINVPPVAQAGPDQAVHSIDILDHDGPYPVVYLDGTCSFDLNPGDTLTYSWAWCLDNSDPMIPDGSTATLSDANTATPSFTPDLPGEYCIKLTVSDGELTDTDTVLVIAGLTWYVDTCGANGWDGTLPAYTTGGHGPWREIDWAISQASDGDRIVVGPTTNILGTPCASHYGGAVPEDILVNKWLTIISRSGAANTVINVSGQDTPENVVRINHDRVVFGDGEHGFTLRGAPRGIWAWDSDYLTIRDNIIQIDDASWFGGIGMTIETCKAPVIDDNTVEVTSVWFGTGIELILCGVGMADCTPMGAQVTCNTVTVVADDFADGIILTGCPEAVVDHNTVNVTAGPSCIGTGIGLYDGCDKAVVTDNCVGVIVSGNVVGAGFGIEVMNSLKVTVGGPGEDGNTVDVNVTAPTACLGGVLAIGIHMGNAPKAVVDNNDVIVRGTANATDTVIGDSTKGVGALDAEEIADVEDAIEALCGPVSFAAAGGLVVGILAWCSDWIDITDNEVKAEASVCVTSVAREVIDGEIALGAGAAISIGIGVLCSMAPDVIGNDLYTPDVSDGTNGDGFGNVDALLDIKVLAEEEVAVTQVAIGGGIAIALGIVVAFCPPDVIHGWTAVVSNNDVQAKGHVDALLESYETLVFPDAAASEDSVLGKLDTDVLNVVYDIVTDSVESEEIDVQINGNPEALCTISAGGALGLAIGIFTLMSDGAQVTLNNPVIARGTVDVTVIGIKELGPIAQFTLSVGGGLGLGIGILDAWCMGTVVSDNNVTAYGGATVDVEAAEVYSDDDCATAVGGAAGIGLGILVIGPVCLLDEQEVDAEHMPMGTAFVLRNVVDADGSALLTVQAYDLRLDGLALALGGALGVGMGIVVVGHWAPVIAGNWVNADGVADSDVYAASVSAVDPLAAGVGVGIGVGIMTVFCPGAQIMDNSAYGCGYAYGEVDSLDETVYAETAVSLGTSLGVGIGIVVAMSSFASVGPNEQGQHAQGYGNAEVDVSATENEPLELASSIALGAGIGKGIVIAYLCKAWVKESNTFIGDGSVIIVVSAEGNYEHEIGCGLALGIDALIVGVGGRGGRGFMAFDEDVEGEHGSWVSVRFNYNNMPQIGGSSAVGGIAIDLGMLAVDAYCVDARYNYWGDPSGPGGFGPGSGQPIVWCCAYVKFVPWLWAQHEWQLDNHIGKYGKYICLDWSWNTFSTPIALEAVEGSYNTWAGILELSGNPTGISAPMLWNAQTGLWEVATVIEPLTGYYITVEDPVCLILLASIDYSMPTKQLYQGWNLIGPNPQFCKCGMRVGDAISPVARADGYAGFSHVISTSPSQSNWSYTLLQWLNGDPGPMMKSGRAYWVRMNSDEILSGFGFTPIGIYPDDP